MNPWKFYRQLAEKLIENTFKYTTVRRSSGGSVVEGEPDFEHVICGVGIHLMPMHRKRLKKDGTETNSVYEGRFAVCKDSEKRKFIKSKFICSACKSDGDKDVYLCNSDTGFHCFEVHIQAMHDIGPSDV